ncbi:hypothetical protein [Acinetobacter rongchengensis]|uniref:Lipoprotein n=1 Tax=Acinetobacter rongchengensis TaxID=2419601 RepID=A0A3A8EPK7_9GAMM|nr:hypothetical protein [Acinetobacter rongchengensis]RKG36812.1 hypothetical protein D7V20_13515 [Acinetobacter rongchengensis]
MKNNFLILSIILFSLIGCKKKYEETFEYKIFDKEICAIKNKIVEKSNKINWLFPEVRNSTGKVISENLKIDKNTTEYLFCSDLDNFKNELGEGIIQSDIAIELDYTSSVQEYNLRNYSCIINNTIKLNLSKQDLHKICIK